MNIEDYIQQNKTAFIYYVFLMVKKITVYF